MMARTSLLILTLCVGCHGYLAQDNPQLPSREAPTASGELLEARAGSLFLKPAHDDIEALLQTGLVDADGGVRVTNTLSPSSPLQPNDLIVAAGLTFPSDYIDSPLVEAPTIADLRRFAVAPSCALMVTVERNGERDHFKAGELSAMGKPLATTPDPDRGDRYGYHTCEITGWPESQWPAHARAFGNRLHEEGRELHLVLDVAEDSDAARQGLRPLDVILTRPVETVTGTGRRLSDPGESDLDFPMFGLQVAHVDGTIDHIRPDLYRDAINIWVPLLFSWESDGTRTHVGIGPLDVLFHYSSDANYDHRFDSYHTGSRWSLLTTIQSSASTAPTGTSGFHGASILDLSRITYAVERLSLQSRGQ